MWIDILSNKNRLPVTAYATVVLALILSACGVDTNQSISPAVATMFAKDRQSAIALTPTSLPDILKSCPPPKDGSSLIYQGLPLTVRAGHLLFVGPNGQETPLVEQQEQDGIHVNLPGFLGLSKAAGAVAIIERDEQGKIIKYKTIGPKEDCPKPKP